MRRSKLERFGKQVAALTAPEVTTRVGLAQSMARQLARQQEALDKEAARPEGRPEREKAFARSSGA